MVSIRGINQNKRRKWTYPEIISKDGLSHIQIKFPFLRLTIYQNLQKTLMKLVVDAAMPYSSRSELQGAVATPLRFNQAELYDLIRDFNLSREISEVIASWLNEKNLQPATNITFYRTREKVLLPYFSRENNLVFCNDVGGLLQKMG